MEIELIAEQAYFDEALEHRERFRHGLERAPSAAVHRGAAAGIYTSVQDALSHLRGPEEAVAFGRMDTEDAETFYVGYNAIWNNDRDILVVNWQAPIAEPYFLANTSDAMGLVRRREFTVDEQNQISEFEDLLFANLLADVARLQGREGPVQQELERMPARVPFNVPSDALLSDLERRRTGDMQDIVRTIQAAQFGIISEPLNQLLVVQGGPGTGKTAIGLHRVSWLLFRHQDELKPADVLVVGPNRTFVRYIKGVLPSLGDRDIDQLPLTDLAPAVMTGRTEDHDLLRLKGELRMMSLVDRGLADRIAVPDGLLEISSGTANVRFERAGREDLADQVERLRTRPYLLGRQALRVWLRDYAAKHRGQMLPADVLDNFLERIWPQLTAPAFLQDLWGSEARLLKAAGDDFTAREVRLLYRRSADRLGEETWSAADLPVLDFADFAISGRTPQRYRHIVVDEAQDLSPMELRSISRRCSTGSMTILGDLAQSTGNWARNSWDDVVAQLQGDCPPKLTELAFGYRVPRQVFEFAAQLLPLAAPGLTPPKVVRDGPAEPTLVHVSADELAAETVREARRYAGLGYSVGVICPVSRWEEVRGGFAREGAQCRDAARDGIGAGINLLHPTQVKGLEFDAVVVVEPELIMLESEPGTRLLYIALTRTTTFLSVVHAGEALPLGGGIDVAPMVVVPTPPALAVSPKSFATPAPRVVTMLADALAEEVRGSLAPGLWEELIAQIRERLTPSDIVSGAPTSSDVTGLPPKVMELIAREAPHHLAQFQVLFAERCLRELGVTSELKGGQPGSQVKFYPPSGYPRSRAALVETHTGRCDVFADASNPEGTELAWPIPDAKASGWMLYLTSKAHVDEAVLLVRRVLAER